MNLKSVLALAAFACAFANPLVTARAQTQGDLLLAVSEGTSGGLDHAQVINKYKGLADVISKVLKKPVNVVFAREFSTLDEGTKTGRFDFVMARPSNYPAKAVKEYGYSFVASAKPEGQCFVIVSKDSSIKTLAEIAGKRIVLPEQTAYMTNFCKAELRDQGIVLGKEKVTYLREQAAVGFYLENKLADVGGVASYSGLAKNWEKSGHRVLHKSRAQPYFPLVAGARVRPEQVKAIQQELANLDDVPEGEEVLKRIGIKEFDITSGPKLDALLTWLEK